MAIWDPSGQTLVNVYGGRFFPVANISIFTDVS